ncbi:MAG: hypothetical protein ACYS21_20830, partial [Planctomycetota bacterium]
MCKKFIYLILFVTFACGTMAMASDMALYDGTPNPDWYIAATMDADVATIIAQTGHLFGDVQTFDDNQLAAFGTWVDARTNDGVLDIIWLNGTIPSVLYQFPNVNPDGSRAELWLDGGNMIINVGDWFAYCSYEGGTRQADNGPSGAGNILDLANGIIVSNQSFVMQITAAGTTYLPSLNSVNVIRPTGLSQVTGDWEVAEIFAQNAGGTLADPVVLHNTVTDGYVAFINQSNNANAITDRGLTTSEFILNWGNTVVGFRPVTQAHSPDPKHKAVDVPADANLAWTRGLYAIQDQVYFGTDPVMANLPLIATLSSIQPALVDFTEDLVASTTYYWYVVETDGKDLVASTTYYWYVVETDGNIVQHTPDTPWYFSTVRGEAQPVYPTDGSIILGDDYPPTGTPTHIYTPLDFTPGATAETFTGYFSDDYAKVAGRAQDANLGPRPFPTSTTPNRYYAGLPLGTLPYQDTLERGTLYHWTVGWREGAQVNEHDVYMSTSWTDTNDANYSPSPPYKPEFLATTTEPNLMVTGLPFGVRQYWRVDEVFGRFMPPIGGGTYYKGPVWTFTVLPEGVGTIREDLWWDTTGALPELKANPDFPSNPDETRILTEFNSGTNLGDNYGGMIHGWLQVAKSGDYRFWICTDDNSELWLSTDESPSNMELIASESSWTNPNIWNTGEEQSGLIPLVTGQKYYIRAIWD